MSRILSDRLQLSLARNGVLVTHRMDSNSPSHAAAPLWLRVAFLVSIGLLLFAVGGLVGHWAGSERSGTAIVGAFWSTLLIFRSARRRRSQLRSAALESIVAGASIGAVMWFFL